jgi:hypothetical protein
MPIKKLIRGALIHQLTRLQPEKAGGCHCTPGRGARKARRPVRRGGREDGLVGFGGSSNGDRFPGTTLTSSVGSLRF